MKRPLASVVAIIPSGNEIVMIRRATAPFAGRWSLPGGHLELGERLEEAVVREVEEELSLKVKVKRLVGFKNFVGRDNGRLYHYVIFCFECATTSYSIKSGEEVLEATLIDPKSLNSEAISPAIKSFLVHEEYI